ncbi:hypothetical protein Glove_166g275 [Diversispora epigaea]|uniref:Uncharacterized protein n=1 Tax=Diversispora epigaea TaxID=1348612 RepID=A0A397IV02_9GLOM|nr:hypothetical protein Glove_166g275 [Diversispora epigaea]
MLIRVFLGIGFGVGSLEIGLFSKEVRSAPPNKAIKEKNFLSSALNGTLSYILKEKKWLMFSKTIPTSLRRFHLLVRCATVYEHLTTVNPNQMNICGFGVDSEWILARDGVPYPQHNQQY